MADTISPTTEPRRLRLVEVSPDQLVNDWKSKRYVRCMNLPADAVVVGVNYDPSRRIFQLAIQSKEYALVDAGSPLRELYLMFEQQDPKICTG